MPDVTPSAEPVRAARKPRRRRRWALLAALALAALLVGIAAGVTWNYSSLVLVPDHDEHFYEDDVRAVAPGKVVLERDEDTIRPGVYGLDWETGHAIAGRVLSSTDETVTRTLRRVDGRLPTGAKVELDPDVYAGDPRQARGLPFERVSIEGELGAMPAWRIPGRGRTWAIFVHGINGSPRAGLRIAPALRRAGLPSLLITYRNDPGAPPAPDGLHHLGMTEWRDVEAAARFALRRGARRLVVIGYSMGGAIVTQFAQRSPLARRLAGLVLDAPALSWKPVFDFQASERGLPKLTTTALEAAIGLRIPVDWDRLDALRHSAQLSVPILLFHGLEDDVVPISLSDDFASRLPQSVTYYRVPRAGHVESWNVDPRLYERRLRAFLTAYR
ncbi:MAG TPA: alpha/beta fold hydrolase [Thermoleophilaceae bacterium]|nr:alpha/beta fold hydrolase [Thermoleophilaceae bacterium]